MLNTKFYYIQNESLSGLATSLNGQMKTLEAHEKHDLI